jgi:hypothetical protein
LRVEVERAAEPEGPPIAVTLTLHGDDGSETHAHAALESVQLDPGEVAQVDAKIADLGLSLDDQQFSGRVEVNARVVVEEEGVLG